VGAGRVDGRVRVVELVRGKWLEGRPSRRYGMSRRRSRSLGD